MKILIADEISEKGVSILKNSGHTIDVRPGMKEDELVKIIGDYDAMIVRSATKATRKIIEASNLKVIGRAGVGVDNIDLDAATEKGVLVMNAPSGNIISTAELATALMFTLLRNISQADRSMKGQKWEKKKFSGRQVTGKTLGIIGLGKVGTEVAKRAQGLGLTVIAYDPLIAPELAVRLHVRLVNLDMLLSQADVITIHTTLTPQTKDLIGAEQLGKMKKSAFLINTARGGIVNEEALFQALSEKKIAGAAIDVFTKEPPEDWKLSQLDNCVVTPHLGASTKEAQEEVGSEIAEQIDVYLRKGVVKNAMNLPAALDPVLIPYLDLANKLGVMGAQLARNNVSAIEVKCSGEIAQRDTKILAASAVAGMLTPIIEEKSVNLINALPLAKERGINVVNITSEESPKFKNLIEVAFTSDGDKHSVAGTEIGDKGMRIVLVNGHTVEFEPKGTFLFIEHLDRPGVIGSVGTILGKNNINIAHMDVARNKPRGDAVMILSIDEPMSEDVIEQLKEAENIREATQIIL
ncbi:MAG: phosphoglycerate dehydrogenase [Thermoplasmata archaeon]|nr:phosphoglycerate dehydrogenase [Thermoplasmata archaeon]